MFTGIIQGTGRIRTWEPTAPSGRMTIASSLPDQLHSRIGDSIAVNGICLTVIDYNDHEFKVDVMPETTQRTNLQQLQSGAMVNLEPALLATQRLDGHFVLGHVDMTVPVTQIMEEENAVRMRLALPDRYQPEVVEKGSVAVNGVSLTVTATTATEFEVSLIPHTLHQTNLGQLSRGELVNVETDVLGKYVNGRMNNDSNQPN
ncbi:riboflavin synthase [Fructilactobacillus myrtifloralis]|uniref:Riboflavin synthase n=1 Tax=Fructilactobacillus myrtifloralis TaxID=2940301 RepID=A0ABY5BN62_9LACO|nr:riboflavin synthase [Fructilactobacillus myrtifloralis]USS85110.1 riboflavin synthase [Fructilactobacillus myrtifloralis]